MGDDGRLFLKVFICVSVVHVEVGVDDKADRLLGNIFQCRRQ